MFKLIFCSLIIFNISSNTSIYNNLNIPSSELKKILDYFNNEEKNCTWIQEYPIISSLIEEMNLKVGCELGVAYGGQSEHILNNTNVKKLYSIDPYKSFTNGEYKDVMNWNQTMHDVLFIKVKYKLSKFDNRSILLRNTSVEAVLNFSNESLDFIYIDANHDYKHILQDLNLWFPKVKSGGLVSGDDYQVWQSVAKAVTEFTKNLKLQFNIKGNKWWFIKP